MFPGSGVDEMVKTKKEILDEFFELGGNMDQKTLNSIRTALVFYLREYSCFDIQISDAYTLVSIQLQDVHGYEAFRQCITSAEMPCSRLLYDGLKDFYDVQLAVPFIVYMRIFEDAVELSNMILCKLEEYYLESRYDKVKWAVSGNMQRRLLLYKYTKSYRAQDLDEDVEAIDNLFDHHYKIAMDYCEKYDNQAYKAVFLVRKGCYYQDRSLIKDNIIWLNENERQIERAILEEISVYDLDKNWHK